MRKLRIYAIVEGNIDYEIEVEDNATQEEIDNIAYEEMPTGGWESYGINNIIEQQEEDYNCPNCGNEVEYEDQYCDECKDILGIE